MSTEQENPQEATDPNIGRVIEMAGNSRGEPRTATIVARKGTHYQLDVSDGTAAWIRADRVEKQTRAEQAGSASAHASDVIRRFQQSASAIPSAARKLYT